MGGGDSGSHVSLEIAVVTMMKKAHYYCANLPSLPLLCLQVTDFSLILLTDQLSPAQIKLLITSAIP